MSLLKIIAVIYLVKTLLVGIAWLFVPDLPQRAMTKARETWVSISEGSVDLRGGTDASPDGHQLPP